ncbi:MAG: hypothetical protein U0528_03145 [Anaerolineae bacterium]
MTISKATNLASDHAASASDHLSDVEREFLLAEYSALREEILKRIELQHQLILGTLVATGTFLTVYFQAGIAAVLLAYPPLAMFLALSWSQNDQRNREITSYLSQKEELFLSNPSVGWEHSRRSSRLWFLGSRKVLAARGIFIGSQLLTILLFVLHLSGTGQLLSVENGILLGVDVLLIMLSVIIIGFPSRTRDKPSKSQ